MLWMHPENLFITYTNCINEYYMSGETVSGTVTLISDKPTKVRAVKIKVSGKAYVRAGRSSCTEATYIDKEIDVWSGSNGVFCGQPMIVTGRYEWAFSFDIPCNCPPSFQFIKKPDLPIDEAYIRYECKVIVFVLSSNHFKV